MKIIKTSGEEQVWFSRKRYCIDNGHFCLIKDGVRRYHRKIGPAFIDPSRSMIQWAKHGLLSRIDGPSVDGIDAGIHAKWRDPFLKESTINLNSRSFSEETYWNL